MSAWVDTWGAPRFAGGYHPHHGQDLMCAEGTPLLAVKPGTLEMHSDPLGGTTLFLVRPDGSFWYYAHLSRYANGIVDGEHVRTGERIGLCGATGDATISHLHFALFSPSGEAIDPMRDLVSWLHDAERTSGLDVSNGTGVHVPKAFRDNGDAGAEPADVLAIPSPRQLIVPAPAEAAPYVSASDLVVTSDPGGTGFGLMAGATLLLLPLPLLSRRVREAGARQLRRASPSS